MQIPQYELLQELSRGPLTSVYIVRNRLSGQIMLLKILNPQHAKDPEITKRFLRETEMIMRFNHENIVKVYDHGSYQSVPFTVMEYVRGWNLRDFANLNHPLPLAIALSVFEKILDALAYAHENDIIHRDIKPSNILVGVNGSIKLTDFGLAQSQDLSAITEHGNMIGTPAYIAPEILQGQPSSAKSDIFSAGLTFFEVLTGENPFKGESIAVTIHNIMNKTLPGLPDYRADIPQWLDLLIKKMTWKDVAQRIESVDRICREIKEHTSGLNMPDLAKFTQNRVNDTIDLPLLNHGNQRTGGIRMRVGFVLLAFILMISVFYWAGIKFPNQVPDAVSRPENTPAENTNNLDSSRADEQPQQVAYVRPENIIKEVTNPSPMSRMQANPPDMGYTSHDIKMGGLFIVAAPWAYIKINGTVQDTTPMSEPLPLRAGEYQITVENPSYKVYDNSLAVKAGQIDSLYIILDEKYGYLNVSVVPWGEIYLNDTFVETTPLKAPVKIEGGHYLLTVKNPYFKSHQQEIEIRPGEREDIVVFLE